MDSPEVKPLPRGHRRRILFTFVTLFAVILPLLFLYATGYRFDLSEDLPFVSTGGIYVAAEKTGAEIYIDGELVRETRTFRTAFYAQGLDPATHRVHVQKEGHHTWVKELPVYPHIVTEAQAFNLPLIPEVRIISPWKNRIGETVLFATSTIVASTTNDVFVAGATATTSLITDTEYASLLLLFGTTTATTSETLGQRALSQIETLFTATTTASTTTKGNATSTKKSGDVILYEDERDIYAMWVGTREDMPYYYCAEEFDLIGTSTSATGTAQGLALGANTVESEEELEGLIGPVQQIPEDAICEPVIKIDRKWQAVTSFTFFPGSTDFVVLALEDGVYVVEIDPRAWQNVQPLILEDGLDVRVENNNVYVYDGELIYQILLD